MAKIIIMIANAIANIASKTLSGLVLAFGVCAVGGTGCGDIFKVV